MSVPVVGGVKAHSPSTTEISELSIRRVQTPASESQGAIQGSHRQGRRDISLGGGVCNGHYIGKGKIWRKRWSMRETFVVPCLEGQMLKVVPKLLTSFPESQ